MNAGITHAGYGRGFDGVRLARLSVRESKLCWRWRIDASSLNACPWLPRAVPKDYTARMKLLRERVSFSSLALGICLLCVSAAFGQSGTRLEGRVMDETGGPVPGATLTLYSDDRVSTTRADWDGKFVFINLPAHPRYLEASSPGFLDTSISIVGKAPEEVTFTLQVGKAPWGPIVIGCVSPILLSLPPSVSPPTVSYEEQSGNVRVIGSVGDSSGAPLPNATVALWRADLNAPLATGPDTQLDPSMRERAFKHTLVAQMTSNEKGEFQFTDIEPGWYTLKGGHNNSSGGAEFWIARETLTRLTRIYLFDVAPCGFEFE
jgi:protocatechuate 3,4-dioxygenase beta subunit